ncbi:MAG: hypothetical protein ABI151_16115 [Chitinophagaceae bacterium]
MQTAIKGKYRILLPLALTIYIAWWLLIALGNFPETSLPIASNLAHYKIFDEVFYQRWGFFAPPPNEDDRLYYVFTNNSDSSKNITFEIFEKLLHEKREKYLLNDDLSNLDYILYNTTSPIEDQLRDGFEIYKQKNKCSDHPGACSYDEYVKMARSDFDHTPQLTALIKHADIVRKKQGLDNNYSVQVVLAKISIHRFAQRFSTKPRDENPYFKSDLYNLKDKSWKKYTE